MASTLTRERPEANVYARLVGELRAILTAHEIAAASGVNERQVHHWRAGETRPRGRASARLLETHYLIEGLRDVYAPEGIEVFWRGRNRSLGGRRPRELAAEGDFEPILEIVEQLRDSNF